MSNIDKHSLENDESVKTYYIHPAAFGSTKNPGYGHVPVVHAEDFEKQRAKLEAAEKRIAELEVLASTKRPYQIENGKWGCSVCHKRHHEHAVEAALCCAAAGKGEAS
ncbi:hypothetical protein [Enterobacter asburiae]|uniref:hypothetical protein n=1 Tax=Enterobacter asburiae TaxID=61645 RepID=UPI0030180F3F